jgi:hypothetical protein
MSPADRDVLTSLPRTRPTRRSAKRDAVAGKTEPAKAAATPKAKPAAATKAKAKPAAKRATASKAPAAGKSTPKRPAAAKTGGTAKAAKPAATKPKRAAARSQAAAPAAKTETRREPPTPPPAGWATPHAHESRRGGTGELLGTAAQAVGELAQIGLTFGGQALRQALSRLPKP